MLSVLGNTSCDLDPKVNTLFDIDPKVKGQVMYFLLNVSPPKPSDVTT